MTTTQGSSPYACAAATTDQDGMPFILLLVVKWYPETNRS